MGVTAAYNNRPTRYASRSARDVLFLLESVGISPANPAPFLHTALLCVSPAETQCNFGTTSLNISHEWIHQKMSKAAIVVRQFMGSEDLVNEVYACVF